MTGSTDWSLVKYNQIHWHICTFTLVLLNFFKWVKEKKKEETVVNLFLVVLKSWSEEKGQKIHSVQLDKGQEVESDLLFPLRTLEAKNDYPYFICDWILFLFLLTSELGCWFCLFTCTATEFVMFLGLDGQNKLLWLSLRVKLKRRRRSKSKSNSTVNV